MNNKTQPSIHLPKPGERWCSKSDGPDVIVDKIDRNRFSVRRIRPPNQDHPQECIVPAFDYIALDSFLETYEKLKTESPDLIVHQFSTGTELIEMAFEPESSRLSRLSVRIRNSRFPICTMEFNDINPTNPVEYLANLDRNHVRDALFGLRTESPDFLATMVCVNDLKLGDSIYEDLIKAMKEFDGCHKQACEGLVDLLRNQKLPDFDPECIIRTRENLAVATFMNDVWEPLRFFLQMEINTGRHLSFTPDRNDGNTPEPG